MHCAFTFLSVYKDEKDPNVADDNVKSYSKSVCFQFSAGKSCSGRAWRAAI